MASARRLLAVDLGASSGRLALGELRHDRLEVALLERFPNRPLPLPSGLHWNLPGLFESILAGLERAAAQGALDGVAVDAWGVDYGLLDADGRLLGLPYHYRDERASERVMEAAHALVPAEELHARTGIQQLPINTVYQLFSERDSAALTVASRLAFVPELITHWLSGEWATEATVASTSGLLDARSGEWARDLISRLGLPPTPFSGEPQEPCRPLGHVLGIYPQAASAAGTPVHLIASHDTACAFAAAPLAGRDEAVLSSGTWSLLGLEVSEPELGPLAATLNLSAERGVHGTFRLLANVMGLWLWQEAQRALSEEHRREISEEQLLDWAAQAPAERVALFDPDAPPLLRPGGLPGKIAALCDRSGQRAPTGAPELLRSILVSLACKYRLVAERLELLTGRRIAAVHVVGGGVANHLLCRQTAEMLGVPVLPGPREATALGNLLCQARSLGEVGSLAQMRELTARSHRAAPIEPRTGDACEEIYERFLELTGLRVDPREPARETVFKPAERERV